MTDPTAKHRVARHAKKKKAEGWIKVTVWVRKEDRERLIAYAERLRRRG